MTSEEIARSLSDGTLAIQPKVFVSAFDRWLRTFILLLSCVTIGILLLLLVRLETLETLGERNRAIDCRMLVLDGQVLDPNGDCFDPDVLKYYDPDTGRAR